MTDPDYQLHLDSFGRLILTTRQGGTTEVLPVRAFPITAPDRCIALTDGQGHEQAWIDNLTDLPPALRELVSKALASREFMPVISRIREVSGFITPCTWQVETDKGNTTFILKGEEDIRRLTAPALLVTDQQGIHYLIPDRLTLDRHSRKILDHFL